jgi:hypothetical protein
MQLREHVVMTKIPSRARLDQLTTASTPGEPGGHHGLEKSTGLAVTAAISPRLAPIRRRPASSPFIGQHRQSIGEKQREV